MQFFPLALSIAVLAGIWTYVSGQFNILTWPAFVGWALFFASGGNAESVKKVFWPAACGVILGYLAVVLAPYLGGAGIGVAVAVTIIAFIMVMLAPVSLFGFVPAQFASCATFFGTGAKFWPTVIPLVIGIGLGYLSALLPQLFTAKQQEKSNKTG
ncbi:MAG: DUF1097 domain-containing protein [Moorellaceae bacterium]